MKGKLKNIFFIMVLGSVSACLLLGIRAYTLPKIEQYEELKFKSTILEAAGIDYAENNLIDIFNKNVKEEKKGELIYYLSPSNHYIFEFEGRGLWGMIRGVVTLNSDLETIETIRIISQEETPGLGARIGEEGFLSQFKKKKVSPVLSLVLRQKAVKNTEIDTVTGASITSQALINMINKAVVDFRGNF